jgi:cyclomaltodextrinase
MQALLRGHFALLIFIRTISALNPDSIFHDPDDVFYVNQQIGEIRFKVPKNSIDDAFLVIGTNRLRMNIGYRDDRFEYYVANLAPFDSSLVYGFLIKDETDSLHLPPEGDYHATGAVLQVPDDAMSKTYYFISIDGFFNGNVANDPANKNEWNSSPDDWIPFGGDIDGITDKMDYLISLGLDIILLSPLCKANSNHKLNPNDYATVDPAYGDTNTLKMLIAAAHGVGSKIVLNLVFTHTGVDFPAFTDIKKNGRASRYTNWYRIGSMPTDSAGFKYESWRTDTLFPLLNLRNEQLQNYLIGFADYWAHFGFDGLYVGEREEIDPGFLRRLYDHLKIKYPELILISSDSRYQRLSGFDGCFNREFTSNMINYFVNNMISTAAFDSIIHHMLFFQPSQISRASLIGFHDYAMRITTLADTALLELMYAFVFTFCGSPVLFYGDEIGMTECVPLNWGSFNWEISQQNIALTNFIRNLVKIRRENPEIADRHFFTLYIDDIKKVYAYDRGGLIVVLNSGSSQSLVELPAWDGSYLDLISGTKYTVVDQKLRLSVDSISFRILKREI